MTTVKEFTVLPVKLGPATHYIFAKEHSSKKEDARYPPKRTLFLASIPTWATVPHVFVCVTMKADTLSALLSSEGVNVSILLDAVSPTDKVRPHFYAHVKARVAYAVFPNAQALRNCLSTLPQECKELTLPTLGLKGCLISSRLAGLTSSVESRVQEPTPVSGRAGGCCQRGRGLV